MGKKKEIVKSEESSEESSRPKGVSRRTKRKSSTKTTPIQGHSPEYDPKKDRRKKNNSKIKIKTIKLKITQIDNTVEGEYTFHADLKKKYKKKGEKQDKQENEINPSCDEKQGEQQMDEQQMDEQQSDEQLNDTQKQQSNQEDSQDESSRSEYDEFSEGNSSSNSILNFKLKTPEPPPKKQKRPYKKRNSGLIGIPAELDFYDQKLATEKIRVVRYRKLYTSSKVRCTCSRTGCIKLYCECYSSGSLCHRGCSCRSCRNVFQFKEASSQIKSEMVKKDKRACNCKRSKCVKLYCECKSANVLCNPACACEDCQNGPKDQGRDIVKEILDEHVGNFGSISLDFDDRRK